MITDSCFRGALGAASSNCLYNSGSEIYVGCSNGELIRFALQADDPNKVGPAFCKPQVAFLWTH